jgi:hypothetical protein
MPSVRSSRQPTTSRMPAFAFARRLEGLHDAGKAVAVDDGQCLDAKGAACAKRSSQLLAPRRNEKWDVT